MKILVIFILLLLPFSTSADELYSWTDAKGVVHFGNKPNNSNAQKADLPPIQKENFDKTLQRIRKETPENCINRGGADCSKGADSDGSVICYDGYREAVLPFIFACVEARLSINSIQIVLNNSTEGQNILSLESLNLPPKQNLKSAQISLLVRNDTEIKANNTSVTFKTPKHRFIVAEGPSYIEPHGVAEYILTLSKIVGPFTAADAKQLSAAVRCENCNKILRYNQ